MAERQIADGESQIVDSSAELISTTLSALDKLRLLRNAKTELSLRNEEQKKELFAVDAERAGLLVQKTFLLAQLQTRQKVNFFAPLTFKILLHDLTFVSEHCGSSAAL